MSGSGAASSVTAVIGPPCVKSQRSPADARGPADHGLMPGPVLRPKSMTCEFRRLDTRYRRGAQRLALGKSHVDINLTESPQVAEAVGADISGIALRFSSAVFPVGNHLMLL